MESGDTSHSVKAGCASDCDTYEVEKIVGYRRNVQMNRDEYLVKWQQYPVNESTFEPIHHLVHCRNNLSAFHSRLLKSAGVTANTEVQSDDSDDSDIVLPLEAINEENMLKRMYPNEQESGIAKGWAVKRIVGAQLNNQPYTYLVEYEDQKQLEHIGIDFLREKCPKVFTHNNSLT
ncbi:unnamed protein product [Toxocara canis]|uniref:Chromo domain-containing protein n=1 Tax=Toxocara canis TaxID=6265 RepID=A0A183UBX2_TOXCA|nr:unnamed protein product [Toxocara canis]